MDLSSDVYTEDYADIVLVDPNNADPNSILVAWEGTGDAPNTLYPNAHWLFCGGHAQINDGRILFSGGDPSCENASLPPFKTTIYEPDPNGGAGAWIAGPDEVWDTDPGDCHPNLDLQHTRRFYPTVTRLFNDRVLITDGTCLCGTGDPGEDFGSPDTPVTLGWTGAPEWQWTPLYTAEVNTEANPFDLGFYPMMFQMSDNTVFMAGYAYASAAPAEPPYWSGNDVRTRKLSPALGSWSDAYGDTDPNFQLDPNSLGGSAVLHHRSGVDEVIKVGRAIAGTCHPVFWSPYAWRFRSDTGLWTRLPNMNYGHNHCYAIALPDGRTFVEGGRIDQWLNDNPNDPNDDPND